MLFPRNQIPCNKDFNSFITERNRCTDCKEPFQIIGTVPGLFLQFPRCTYNPFFIRIIQLARRDLQCISFQRIPILFYHQYLTIIHNRNNCCRSIMMDKIPVFRISIGKLHMVFIYFQNSPLVCQFSSHTLYVFAHIFSSRFCYLF